MQSVFHSLSIARILHAQLYNSMKKMNEKVSACHLIARKPLETHMSHHPQNMHYISWSPDIS